MRDQRVTDTSVLNIRPESYTVQAAFKQNFNGATEQCLCQDSLALEV
jgi:hypothetical protein